MFGAIFYMKTFKNNTKVDSKVLKENVTPITTED